MMTMTFLSNPHIYIMSVFLYVTSDRNNIPGGTRKFCSFVLSMSAGWPERIKFVDLQMTLELIVSGLKTAKTVTECFGSVHITLRRTEMYRQKQKFYLRTMTVLESAAKICFVCGP